MGVPLALPGRQSNFENSGSIPPAVWRSPLPREPRAVAVAFAFHRLRSGPFEGPATVKPPALLRNKINRYQVKAEHSGLCMKPCCSLLTLPLLLLLKDGCVVFLSCCDHVVHDPGELMRSSGHCFWDAHSGLHAPEVVSQESVASV